MIQEDQEEASEPEARQLCCCDTFHLMLPIPTESSSITLSGQSATEIPPSRRVWTDERLVDVAKRTIPNTGEVGRCPPPPVDVATKGAHIHVMSAGLFSADPVQLEDLTESSQISWPANPLLQPFVIGASRAVFGEGLAPGAVWNDQQGL